MCRHRIPRQAALDLLPFLLSNPPFIPASHTSAALNQRHQILNISPEDVEDYLITNTYSTTFPTATKSVELLSLLTSQIEQANVDQASVIGKIQYKCPEKNIILVGIELGSKREFASSRLLLLLLKLEGDQQEIESYKYDNLLPINVVPGPWFDTLEEATSFEKSSLEISQTLSRAFPETTPPILVADEDLFDPSHRNNGIEDGEQEIGEYITNADEFWAGFESDEEDKRFESGNAKAVVEESEEDRKRRLQEEEDRYWQMYDQQDSTSKQNSREARDNLHQGSNGVSAKDTSTRNDSVMLLLRKAWRLMQESSPSGGDQSLESGFVSLASEVTQEHKHDIDQ